MKILKFTLLALAVLCTTITTAKNDPTNIYQRIASKISYPSTSVANQEEGTVYLSFDITEENLIVNKKIELGVSFDLNEAALKALDNLTVADIESLKLKEGNHLILPIRFRIL